MFVIFFIFSVIFSMLQDAFLESHMLDTFNHHLKRTCEVLGITYRSSHQIRFTNATLFAEAGIPITEISTMLGHSNTATTMHYIRQSKVSAATVTKIENLLN